MLEVLIAVLVLAILGVSIQSTMVGTLQGVQIDRASEVKRRVCLDLLERFCHPYSDIESLFAVPPQAPPDGGPTKFTRELTVDETLKVIAMPGREATSVKQTLQIGNVRGFNLVWTRGLRVEQAGSPATLRLDRLWCHAVIPRPQPGVTSDAFRMFCLRGR
jgi:hypothetical protein